VAWLQQFKEDPMTVSGQQTLYRLRDSGLDLEQPAADIRGFKVLDRNGDEIGSVDELIIDDAERRVRFLEVASGGFLGMGEKKFMLPIDMISRIGKDEVQVDRTREHVAGAPQYDPDLKQAEDWNNTYGYYGFAPYWAPGYVYPGYPLYLP
jgi:sporulation protein YlmC with PRC-barrel domain